MKIYKIILASLIAAAICAGTIEVSRDYIESKNAAYVPEQPVEPVDSEQEKQQEPGAPLPPIDIDKMISHGVYGTGETTLPVTYQEDYVLYENNLYVTINEGETWMMVPDDDYPGYARISEYLDTISTSNVYVSDKETAIVYGGRGSENISIITPDTDGDYWSISSISQTATHDLQAGYDQLYIDFLEDQNIAYIAAVQNRGSASEEIAAFRSVNTGVTWDETFTDEQYQEVILHFGLQEPAI